MVPSSSRTCRSPTAPGLLYSRIHEAKDFGIDRETAERMGAVSGLESMERIYPEMKRRGIRVVPGGDYGFPYNPVGRNERDLQLFVDLFGYTPVEVLVAATKTAGEMVGFDVGTIEELRLADLLLIDGDPTVDISILQDSSRMVAVMQDGSFHGPPPLAVLRIKQPRPRPIAQVGLRPRPIWRAMMLRWISLEPAPMVPRRALRQWSCMLESRV